MPAEMTDVATKWQEKGVGFLSRKGGTEKRVVRDDSDGRVAGHEVEHWDGRQDAVATPATIRVKAKATLEAEK